ncbi:MAG: hypothetical protein CL477_00705 [Acidobacteria bacterium]|jgi:hypothetical protein|nr:hypothetical protein [Acidobacteriota bacterium]|tara:strand:- start:239 stop:442 length:204 start_codon:yes stop_codon:yes gene_type:complete
MRGKESGGNESTILDADAARTTTLFVADRLPECALLAPRRTSASTPGISKIISARVLRLDTARETAA